MGGARRRAWVLAVVAGLAGCSGGGDGGGEALSGAAAESTTTAAGSFEERSAVTDLSLAATGMSLVANEISLRALQGGGAEYCRTQAPAELEPHRATLEAASDREVQERASAALDDLASVVERCAGAGDPAALQAAIQRYDASFQRLRRSLDELIGTGGG